MRTMEAHFAYLCHVQLGSSDGDIGAEGPAGVAGPAGEPGPAGEQAGFLSSNFPQDAKRFHSRKQRFPRMPRTNPSI